MDYYVFLLLLKHQVKEEKAAKVFQACRGIVKNDSNVALYLLPHVVVQVLLDGTQEDQEEVRLSVSTCTVVCYTSALMWCWMAYRRTKRR